LILSRKKERLLDIARLQETYEYALLELVYCYDAVIAVLKVIEVEVDLGLIEDEDVTAVTLLLLVEDEMFFGIEVNRPVDTRNASSEDESDSESSIEAIVVIEVVVVVVVAEVEVVVEVVVVVVVEVVVVVVVVVPKRQKNANATLLLVL
jgi:hypothetical protein